MYLLDSNACIRILKGSSPVVGQFRKHSPSDVRLCSVVKAELLYGARKSARAPDNLRSLTRFFEPFVSLSFDDVCAERYAVIREQLARAGRPIAQNDLLIAAIAVTHDLELVTHNVSEFSQVIGLRIVDWEAGV
jgi:tRNA(fMet)-specific endonuclease VapC